MTDPIYPLPRRRRLWPWILLTLFLLGGGLLFGVVALFWIWMQVGDFEYGRGDIAVVEIEGALLDSKELVEQLDAIDKNPHIRGVLLRINSPGGGVAASQEIYQAVLRLKPEKKIVVSMGTVAASGGYYIAVAADRIVANPGTITGSIGVILDHTNVQDLLRFLKLDSQVLTAGKYKDVGSPLRPLNDQDRAYLQQILDQLYAQFRQAVKDGRGFSDAEMDAIAEGRVFTGEQALQLKLIDRLGNQQVALDLMKEMLGIEGEPTLIRMRKKPWKALDLLTEEGLQDLLIKSFYEFNQRRALYLSSGV